MEKVRPWCGQPSDQGRLKNRNRNRLTRVVVDKGPLNGCVGRRVLYWVCTSQRQLSSLARLLDTHTSRSPRVAQLCRSLIPLALSSSLQLFARPLQSSLMARAVSCRIHDASPTTANIASCRAVPEMPYRNAKSFRERGVVRVK